MGSDPLLQGDRGYRYHAHSSNTEAGSSIQKFTALGFVLICTFHILLKYLDLAILSPLDILWNGLVYLMPTQLIDFLARITHTEAAEMRLSSIQSTSQIHALKSDALRHILRLQPASPTMAQGLLATRVSGPQASPVKVKVATPPGLGNWDNSCYQNSVLQSLAAIPSVLDFLNNAILSLPGASDTTTGTLHSLTHDLTVSSNNGRQLWTPPKLKSMSSWQQQDAQEYYSRILADIEKEMRASITQDSRNTGLKHVSQEERDRRVAEDDRKMPSIPLEGLLGQRVACVSCRYSEGLSLLPFNCLTVTPGMHQRYTLAELLDDYTKLENIDQVECLSCTLTKHASKLEALIPPADTTSTDSTEAERPTTKAPLPPLVQQQIFSRLRTVREAIEDRDFSDRALTQCSIGKDSRVSSTKTKQVVIARPPQSLAIHVNRSIFSEVTGTMTKNLAFIDFPKAFPLRPWTLGRGDLESQKAVETWPTSPTVSLAPLSTMDVESTDIQYQLKAVVSHFGRHENGHYICYRQHGSSGDDKPADDTDPGQWWRLSDETVTPATEDEVLRQGGVFMLFYEKCETLGTLPVSDSQGTCASSHVEPVQIPVDEVSEEQTPSKEDPKEDPKEDVPVASDTVSAAQSHETEPHDIPAQPEVPKPKVDLSELTHKFTHVEPAGSSPQKLRTSKMGADSTKNHLAAGMHFVTAQ